MQATLSDILKQLGTTSITWPLLQQLYQHISFGYSLLTVLWWRSGNHFGVDLLHRKSEVKDIITEAIQDMSDDEDEEASESGDESGEDGADDEA